MSWVANVMISIDVADRTGAEALSEWLRTDAPRRAHCETYGVGFLKLLTSPESHAWGGWKNPECEVWAGVLNHADLDALRQRVFEMPWREPKLVQLLVMDQEEGFFRMWMIRGGSLRQFAPLEPNEEDDGFYQSW
ncbi:squamosa promoter-binding protein 15 [Streptomyces sp. SID14478]|uniref:squamosa promoter-binding protein 15 n=1 Tax=Streptomyces sp. SID14478 TaxID=2706073 RepID=UPI0013DA16E0|nr:squamosa promoter-binding protein 15 [Streptomyces sp. SID14478]NEB75839.1 squamosa promoter-binding protein 15 [Streptomyces sp. SID14478]